MVPSLNSQMNDDVSTLFRDDITNTRNAKCTVNIRFYDTPSVYIYFDKEFLILLLS